MKRIIITIAKILTSLIVSLFKCCKRNSIGLIFEIIRTIENKTGNFITFHYRPKYSDEIDVKSFDCNSDFSWAIVMQGPIKKEDNFTYETLKLYRKHYPNAILVLSTWETEDIDIINAIKKLGVDVVLNKIPEFRGQYNINLQIFSSGNGMKRAKELGAKYAMKTRADNRFYACNVDTFLLNLMSQYPVVSGLDQKERIIGISFDTLVYRMYGITDFLLFGHIDDMIKYWSPPLDSRSIQPRSFFNSDLTMRKLAEYRVCEVYLSTEYLKKIGRNLDWTLKDSWKVFAENFIIVDSEVFDFMSAKVNRREWHGLFYHGKSYRSQEMKFRDWFILYSSIDKITVPEELLDEI